MSKLREAAEKVEMRPGDKLGAITVGLHDDPGIVLLRRIVDSISIVNKMACWDHFAMFELRDYLCERAELAKPDHFPDAGKMVQDGWIPVAERMPDSGCVVLACYRNSAGNLRRIRAEWVAAKTQESDDASDIGEYDEATDTYYDPQGWYERIDNWDDGFSAVGVSQGEVTHWMHLPDAPGAAAPRPAPAEPQPAAQQEPLTVDYSGCDICARETATIAGFRLMVDPSLPPDVLVFRQGEREVGRIINAGITATKGER